MFLLHCVLLFLFDPLTWLIFLEFILQWCVCGVYSSVFFSQMSVKLSQQAIPFFPCLIKMSSLLNTKFFHVFGSISVLFILFYCLTVCSHISILIIWALQSVLVFNRSALLPSKFFFPMFSFFHVNFRILTFYHPKNPIDIFVGMAWNQMFI